MDNINYEKTCKILAERIAKLELENALYIATIDDLSAKVAELEDAELSLMGGAD